MYDLFLSGVENIQKARQTDKDKENDKVNVNESGIQVKGMQVLYFCDSEITSE